MKCRARAVIFAAVSLVLIYPGTTGRAMAAHAAIVLTPQAGPPGTKVAITGAGFQADERVVVTFDGTQVTRATATSTGGFGTSFTVPRASLPGNHTVDAIGQASGYSGGAGFLVRTNWTKYQFDLANSGVNPYENTLSQTNVSNLRQRWSTQLAPLQGGYLDDVVSSPAVVDGRVFIGSADKTFIALDEATGMIDWQVSTGGTVAASPTVAGGIVYVESNDSVLHAYRADTGITVWTRALASGLIGNPAVTGGVVYQASGTTLYALAAATGKIIWSAQAPDAGPFTTPAIDRGMVIIESGIYWCCSFSLHVEALNALNGSLVWSYAAYGSGGETAGTGPLVHGGVVYMGVGRSGLLVALSETNGAQLWTVSARDIVTGIPTIARGVLYVEDQLTLAWFNASTGQNISFCYCAGAGAGTSPMLANNVLYVLAGGLVRAFKPGGYTPLWSAAPGGNGTLQSSPVIADGTLFVGSNSDTLVAYALP